MHAHAGEQMIYVLQGALRALVDGEEVTVREGEVLQVPAGVRASGRSARRHVRAGSFAARTDRTGSAHDHDRLILLGVIVVVALWVIGGYNRLVGLRNQTQNGWRQIDVQLKRRHDLIPNLVNTVKGSMEFERDTLTAVMDARARAMAATGSGRREPQKEGELTQALGRLFAVAENYPQLKSNENVQDAAGRAGRRPRTRSASRASSTTTSRRVQHRARDVPVQLHRRRRSTSRPPSCSRSPTTRIERCRRSI